MSWLLVGQIILLLVVFFVLLEHFIGKVYISKATSEWMARVGLVQATKEQKEAKEL